MKKVEKNIELGGRKLTLTTGGFAEQASSAVMAQYGDTVVMATVVAAPLVEDRGYFPLSVEYMERLYAGGRIKGSRWVKREGKPTDEEILIGRLIDRSIRPLFPKDYIADVQVSITVLSVDLENSPDIPAAIAASAALASSSIPWSGPVGVVKVGMRDGSYFTNPRDAELEYSDMELVVSATEEAIVMVEAGSREVSEERILAAIEYGQGEAKNVISFIKEFASEVGATKEKVEKMKVEASLEKKVKELARTKIKEIARYQDFDEVAAALVEAFADEDGRQVKAVFENYFKGEVRAMVLAGKRLDGRKLDEVRKITAQVGVLPRTHGSAVFTRGQTQAMSITTLGSPTLSQLIETAEGEESKRYMHHYSMPPYSTGETGRYGSPSRREIGHGALAERALLAVIPSEDKFPYTIRVVSEVLSSNGSTSMASVCGSTLSLMDAGVPVAAPVGGIAMGLVIDGDKHAVLTDIAGIEDGMGDMDFKVAGTEAGVTALQLDVKTLGLTTKILGKALDQARAGRLQILGEMIKAIAEPRVKVSDYAPKIKVIKIDTDKIGELIGPGGRNIKRLIAETGAEINVEDDGTVSISGISSDAVDTAYSRVEAITKDVVPGEIYTGIVKRIQPFGAFVEILPGKEGLVHVSDMSEEYVKDPADEVNMGQEVQVRVKEIDEMGRINLSMRMDASKDKKKVERRNFPKRRFEGDRKSGPHFPTSRLIDKKNFSR